MRKRVSLLLLPFLPLLPITQTAAACTGFAVYSGGRAWYGMNFDYPERSEIAFTISEREERIIFRMLFEEDDRWIPTVAMNDRGLFASMQYQCPMIEGKDVPGEDEIYVWQVFEVSTTLFSTVSQVREILDEAQLIQMEFPTLHLLAADPDGNAIIAEAGDEGNAITEMEHGFLVMTNFRNADFTGISGDLVRGVGAERYITAYALLSEFEGVVGPREVMNVLKETRNEDDVYVTRVSMVFDPYKAEVYICLAGDFDRIWKASLSEGMLETWSAPDGERISFDLSEPLSESNMLTALPTRPGS
jgi:hypothetical protein